LDRAWTVNETNYTKTTRMSETLYIINLCLKEMQTAFEQEEDKD